MSNMQLRLVKARLEAIKRSLANTPHKEQSKHISITTADDFNSMLKQIVTAVPEATESLPSPITKDGMGAVHFKLADATFLDLALAVDQAIAVVEVLDSENE